MSAFHSNFMNLEESSNFRPIFSLYGRHITHAFSLQRWKRRYFKLREGNKLYYAKSSDVSRIIQFCRGDFRAARELLFQCMVVLFLIFAIYPMALYEHLSDHVKGV